MKCEKNPLLTFYKLLHCLDLAILNVSNRKQFFHTTPLPTPTQANDIFLLYREALSNALFTLVHKGKTGSLPTVIRYEKTLIGLIMKVAGISKQ